MTAHRHDESPSDLGKRQALFREVNERIERVAASLSLQPGDRVALVCECALDDCVERVDLTLAEYETVRHDSRRFVIKPGHELPHIERVVHAGNGYAIVEKVGDAAEAVVALDPREPAR